MSRCYLDTSALAKWYLQEPGSEAFETFVNRPVAKSISRLVVVEMRCLLDRRRRSGEISVGYEEQAYAMFRRHLAGGVIVVEAMVDEQLIDALALLERLREHALRTLDFLHLAAARAAACDAIATGDRVMADAGRELGLAIEFFGTD